MANAQKETNNQQISPSDTEAGEELTVESLIQHLTNGATLADVVGITKEQREAVYSMGHFHFEQGKYLDAMKFFRFLLFYDQFEKRAMFGLGCCLKMLGQYEQAQIFLGLAVMMDPSDAGPGVQFAECLLLTGKKVEAISLLQKTLNEFGKIPKHEMLIRKVEALLQLASRPTEVRINSKGE